MGLLIFFWGLSKSEIARLHTEVIRWIHFYVWIQSSLNLVVVQNIWHGVIRGNPTVYRKKHSVEQNSRSQKKILSIWEASLGNSINPDGHSFRSDETPNGRHCSITNLKTLQASPFVVTPIYSHVFFEYQLPDLQWIYSLHMQQRGWRFHAERLVLGFQEAIISPCWVSHLNSFRCVTGNESRRITSTQPKSYLTCTQTHTCTNSTQI